jgi:2-hydroxychromene-2-carboxylate isomerase
MGGNPTVANGIYGLDPAIWASIGTACQRWLNVVRKWTRGRLHMIDFWISIGSTYSYLSVMRLGEVEKSTGVPFRWRPFSVRSIMVEQNNIPFKGKPVKSAYMWRDIERRAGMYGLSPKLPATYPLAEFDLANLVAVVGEQEGWCQNYVRATYQHWFERGEAAGSEPNLSNSLREIGQNPDRIRELARGETAARLYEMATQEAKALGVFGSPTFVVNKEVFWGDDRLHDAIRWFKHGPT